MQFLQSDRRLDADITKAGTFEDLRALLENATVRTQPAERDHDTLRRPLFAATR